MRAERHNSDAMRLVSLLCQCLVWVALTLVVPPEGANAQLDATPPSPSSATASASVRASELTFDKRTHERKLQEAKAELETVRQARGRVSSFQTWVFWLGITLIGLGLLTACAQLLADPWNKRVTTVLGALVVAVTTTKSGYFPMESKVIGALVAPADDAIKDQETYLGFYHNELQASTPDEGAIRDYLERLTGDRTMLLQVHETLREAGLSLGFATPLRPASTPPKKAFLPVVYAQSSVSARTATASGVGESNDPKAAREYARYSALESLARKAVKDQRRDDLDAVIEYLGQSARIEKFKSEKRPEGMTRYSLVYSISEQALDQAELQVGAKRDPFIQWASNAVTVARPDLAAGRIRRVVSLQSSKATMQAVSARQGKFFDLQLDLSAAAGGKTMAIELIQTDAYSDGSLGSTRWAFEVLVNGQVAIMVPNHRYNAARKPTIYRIPADERRRGEAPLADRMTVQVNAYSPR